MPRRNTYIALKERLYLHGVQETSDLGVGIECLPGDNLVGYNGACDHSGRKRDEEEEPLEEHVWRVVKARGKSQHYLEEQALKVLREFWAVSVGDGR